MRVVPSPSHFSIYFCPLRADIGRWLPPAALWRWPWERLPANCGEDRRRQEEDMGPTAKKKGLTVKRVENLLRAGVPGKHTDGDVKGLMLCVESRSSAAWTLRWQRAAQEHARGPLPRGPRRDGRARGRSECRCAMPAVHHLDRVPAWRGAQGDLERGLFRRG